MELVENYAEITYVALFDNYWVEYGGRTYLNDGRYTMFDGKRKKFATLNEAKDFCKEVGATIVKEFKIDHPLAHGLPDCRAIRPDIQKYL